MQLSNNQRSIMLPWLFATVAGVVLGIIGVLTLVSGLALAGVSTLLVGLIGGAGVGAAVGIAQWIVLRRHIPIVAWVPASIVGGMLGVALGGVLADALRPVLAALLGEAVQARTFGPQAAWSSLVAGGVAGTVIGVVLGSAQWVVLRRYVPVASWWIVASEVGWMAGLGIGAGSLAVFGLPLSLLALGGVVGAVTGGTQAYLLAEGTAPSRRIPAS